MASFQISGLSIRQTLCFGQRDQTSNFSSRRSAERTPTTGPALRASGLIPDAHHYAGSFGGRVFPLWADEQATQSNLKPALLSYLSKTLGRPVTPEDLFSYIAAIAANPAYTARFQPDLSTPGLRVPLTADPALFREAADLGRRVLWLQTFGDRMADPAKGRPVGPPRVAHKPAIDPARGPHIGQARRFPGHPELRRRKAAPARRPRLHRQRLARCLGLRSFREACPHAVVQLP